jgi:phosphatidylcholine synthase
LPQRQFLMRRQQRLGKPKKLGYESQMTPKTRALAVHLFTATGAVFAMLAMLAAVEHKWSLMYLWLVVAFIVDGIDGPLARKYQVKTHAAEFDGELLDLIIDYLTYVFIPAFALFSSGLLPDWTGWVCILVITFTSAMYFADTRMKTKDYSFAGFPGCWNMVVLVLFVTEPNFWVILGIVVVIAASMFTRLEFVHPVRTKRWRSVTLPVALAWTFFAGWAAWLDFDPGQLVITALSISSGYLLFAGIAMQIIPQKSRAD